MDFRVTLWPYVLIRSDALLTHIPDAPKDRSWITQVEHANTLGLHRRGLAQNAGKPLRKLLALDVLPPGIRILDSQARHETSRMLFDVKCLQQKTERADLGLRNLIVAPIDGESEVGIKLPGECGIFGWHERLEIGHGTRMHWLFPNAKYRELACYRNRHARTGRLFCTA
jgi:hypothetical protein